MPPVDKPPAALDGADSQPSLTQDAHPPTSRKRQIIAGAIAVIGGALILVTAAYLAFTWAFGSNWKTYLVGGGAIVIILVLAIVLMLYAPLPTNSQPLPRIEDRSVGWAIGYAVLVLMWSVGVGFELYDMTQSSLNIGQVLLVVVLVGAITGTTTILIRWFKARRTRRDRSRAGQ
jgi:protein-S-isoprenylcysteine O-methyltransferase Ste14